MLFRSSAKEWTQNNRTELENTLIDRSPWAACKFATETNRRVHDEKRLQEACYRSQKDKKWWLKYCTHFTIIPDNHHQIILETYGEQDHKDRQFTKAYLQRLKQAKNDALKFITEILDDKKMNRDRPIRDLMEILEK